MFVDKNSAERVKLVIDHILKLQNYIQSLEALQIDSEEFAYLKALVLFSPGKWITVESLNFLWGPIFVDFRFFAFSWECNFMDAFSVSVKKNHSFYI